MKRPLAGLAVRTAILAFVLSTRIAPAEDAPPAIAGTWTLAVVDNVLPDGTRVHLYGDRPEGLLVLGADGRYSLQIFSADRAKFVAGDKSKGTPEEYRAAVQGSNAHYGRFRVEGGVLVFQIEHASYPNWEGVEQRRPFTLEGDTLRYTVPAPTTGAGASGEVVWKRAANERETKIQRAKGEFDVKLTPQADDKDTGLGRMSIEKTWRGDLAGTSRGEMLTAMTETKGSAGYVAEERFAGTLAGRKGSFTFQHHAVMDRGKPSLEIRVVPDSGTGELAGISGTLTLEITGGKHFYELEYTMGEKP